MRQMPMIQNIRIHAISWGWMRPVVVVMTMVPRTTLGAWRRALLVPMDLHVFCCGERGRRREVREKQHGSQRTARQVHVP